MVMVKVFLIILLRYFFLQPSYNFCWSSSLTPYLCFRRPLSKMCLVVMYVFYGLVSNILCSSGPENENSSGYFSGSSGFTLLWFFAMSFTLLCSNILSSVLCTLLNRKIYAFLLTYLLTYLLKNWLSTGTSKVETNPKYR